MKMRFLVTLMVLLTVSVVHAKEFQVKKQAGDITVQVQMNKNPPVVGTNTIKIDLKDTGGTEVIDAVVVVECSMPAMPGMPAINFKAPTTLNGKTYIGEINLAMSGSWTFTVKIKRAGKTRWMKFNVEAN